MSQTGTATVLFSLWVTVPDSVRGSCKNWRLRTFHTELYVAESVLFSGLEGNSKTEQGGFAAFSKKPREILVLDELLLVGKANF